MGARLAFKALLFAFCCAADAFVLRAAWTGREFESAQFSRGYFEPFDGGIGLALDGAIRPGMVPTFLLTEGDELSIPPGMTAVAPLDRDTTYELRSDSPGAPYVVIGRGEPIELPDRVGSDDARLTDALTPDLRDGRLALVPWDSTRPWGDDAARLSALRSGCVEPTTSGSVRISRSESQLSVVVGHCAVDVPGTSLDSKAMVAALAGPNWMTVVRRPAWQGERWFRWPVLAAVAVKVAALWWAIGAATAVAVSLALGAASLVAPTLAILTWPLTLAIALLAAVLRLAVLVFRRIPVRRRLPVAVGAALLLGGIFALRETSEEPATSGSPVRKDGPGEKCAVIGYSTVKGEGLRGERGGIRSLLGQSCAPCRDETAGLFAGGENLAWARDNYCASVASVGAQGQVIFLGGVNDDFFWGRFSVPRLFIAGQQGADSWQPSKAAASAASLDRVDAQVAALEALMQCARARGAAFLFLHDFLVSDLVGGRDPERAMMLDRRRAAAEAGGGTFVDLLEVFRPQAGVSWFNDYVHLSLPAHQRAAEIACTEATRTMGFREPSDAGPPVASGGGIGSIRTRSPVPWLARHGTGEGY